MSSVPAATERKSSAFPTEPNGRTPKLPPPTLVLDFRLVCKLGQTTLVGPEAIGTDHMRNWVQLDGGHFDGVWGSGVVVPGGLDKQTVEADFATRVDTQYLLRTHDGAHIEVHTDGWRTVGFGGHDVLAKLVDDRAAGSADPAGYTFRLYINMKTGDERYKALNTAMWVASAARLADRVVYDAYRVL